MISDLSQLNQETALKFQEYKNGYYQGEIKSNKKEGKGIYFFDQGQIYIGSWKNDFMEGQGVFYFQNGGYYSGKFRRNKAHDIGVLVNHDGDEIYVGIFLNGAFFEKYYKYQLKEQFLYTYENQKLISKEVLESDPAIPNLYDTYNEIINPQLKQQNSSTNNNKNSEFSVFSNSNSQQSLSQQQNLNSQNDLKNQQKFSKKLSLLKLKDQTWYIGFVNASMVPDGLGVYHNSKNQAISRGLVKGRYLEGLGRKIIDGDIIHDGIFQNDQLILGIKYSIVTNQYEYGNFSNNGIKINQKGHGLPNELLTNRSLAKFINFIIH